MSDNKSMAAEPCGSDTEQAPPVNHVLMQNIQLLVDNGKAYLVFYGQSERVCWPLEMLGWMHAEMDRLAIAHAGTLDPLQRANIATPKTWRTATTQDGRPSVVIDHGLASQQAFAMEPGVAVELGERLAAIGAQGLRPIHTH